MDEVTNLLAEKNARIIRESEHYVIVYIPGRTVYVDSAQGSQYQQAEYVLFEKDPYQEVMRFPRSI